MNDKVTEQTSAPEKRPKKSSGKITKKRILGRINREIDQTIDDVFDAKDDEEMDQVLLDEEADLTFFDEEPGQTVRDEKPKRVSRNGKSEQSARNSKSESAARREKTEQTVQSEKLEEVLRGDKLKQILKSEKSNRKSESGSLRGSEKRTVDNFEREFSESFEEESSGKIKKGFSKSSEKEESDGAVRGSMKNSGKESQKGIRKGIRRVSSKSSEKESERELRRSENDTFDRVEQRIQRRRKNELIIKTLISVLLLVAVILLVLLGIEGVKYFKKYGFSAPSTGALEIGQEKETGSESTTENTDSTAENVTGSSTDSSTSSTTSSGSNAADELIAQADLLAQQYDYDGAIALLTADEHFTTSKTLQAAVSDYEQQKSECVSYPVTQITHIFFHTLIKDDSLAFDGDEDTDGYNQVMTTIDEFNSIIRQMYDKGYVMVSLHDMCTVNEDGTVTQNEIYLPEGKIPFVLSQDDVSYYHYMDGDGFAQKLIVDEDGKVKNTYIEADGSVSIGDYDMVPLIDRFVEEHPDFSYHGHKGIVALTGYEGVLGYRTDEVYKTREASRVTEYQQKFFDENPDFDYEAEVAEATEVADAMKAEGWEFASHTWGHINPSICSLETVEQDTERWKNNVATIVGDTDVLIFAFGADIGDWQGYSSDNEYFAYYKEQGFSIYCNVDASSTYWVQFGDNYMRQGRRNLDGYRMYYNPDMLTDLFDVTQAWDSNRPTPVPEM